MTVSVIEFTDPACPWAWGSEPTFRWLRLALGEQAHWRRVFGILFDTIDDPAPDPAAETAWYARNLLDISRHTSAPYPGRLEWLTRTSWPASIVAKAAEAQGSAVADRVLRRLRETTFILGTPADTMPAALDAAADVPGLDERALADSAEDPATAAAVQRDWAEAREPPAELIGLDGPPPHSGRAKEAHGRYRFALPTLVFAGPGGRSTVPGWRPMTEYHDAVMRCAPDLSITPPVLSPQTALETFGSLTLRDLELLTNGSEPAGVAVQTGNGPIWLDPACHAYRTPRDGD